jgi:hypothetical protein
MVSELQELFDLRRDAEATAQRTFAVASAALDREKEEYERLLGRWQAACATVGHESERLAAGPGPSTVAQGYAREGYLARLRDEANRRRATADEHRTTALAAAQAARDRALADYTRATRDHEAVSKLKQRAQAAKAKRTARNAEEAASDLAGTTRCRR